MAAVFFQAQAPSGWMYTKAFRNGTFIFVGSDSKTYKVHCNKVVYVTGRNSRAGANVCLNTLASVGECTPAAGKDTDTIAFDGETGAMLYRSTLSTEYMKLEEVHPATENEFSAAKRVCSKAKWYHGD
jgi:hypothetical protein